MAVATNKTKDISEEAIKEAILNQISALYDEQVQKIQNIRDRSQEKKITVNFANEIDCSESEPTVCTKIRFSEAFTDERTSTIDTAQGTFSMMQDAGRGGRQSDPAPEAPPAPTEEKPAAA